MAVRLVIGVVLRLVCRRALNGRFIVETEAGDRFEFLVVIRGERSVLRLLGPPRWRQGPWPDDAGAIVAEARRTAVEHAANHGLLAGQLR